MRRERQQVGAERPDVDRNLRDRLHGVGVEERAAGVRQPREIGQGLHGSDLVVGVHHRHERRLVGQRRLEGFRLDDAARVDREQGGGPAAPRQRLERGEDRFVLDRAGDQMPASGDLERFGDAPDRKIVRLGPAAREHDFRHFGLQEVGHRRPGLVHDALGPLAEVVDARRIAEILLEDPRHDLDNGRVDGGGGVVIEIDAHR